MASKARAAFAVAVLLFLGAVSAGAEPPGAKKAAGAQGDEKKGTHRLDEVRITGSADRPGALFFLPRSRFRLEPLREEEDAKGRLPRDDPGRQAPPR